MAPRALAKGSTCWTAQPLEYGPQVGREGAGGHPQFPASSVREPGVVGRPLAVFAGAAECDPGRDATGADDDGPMPAAGSAAFGRRRLDIDPGDKGRTGGQCRLDFLKLCGLPCKRVFLHQRG